MVLLLLVGAAQAATLEIHQDRTGHYYVDGMVGYNPAISVRFIVDTGATGVTVPVGLVTFAGQKGACVMVTYSTANGRASGCQRSIPVLQFGPFVMHNLKAVITSDDSMSQYGLLGMDVLRHYRIEINDGVMRIHSK